MNALDALFRDEVDRQVGPLRDGLKKCLHAPPAGEALFHAQALKGAARVVGVAIAEQMADALELLLGAYEATGTVLTPEQLSAGEEALELIEAVAQAGADHADEVASVAQVQAIVGRLAVASKRAPNRPAQARRAVPAATLELFSTECEQQAAALTQGLLELESHPESTAWVEPLMRAAHSVKGAARVVGFEAAVALAHAMEDQFDRARQSSLLLGPDLVDALLAASDLFQRIGSGTPPSDETLIEATARITALGASSAARGQALTALPARALASRADSREDFGLGAAAPQAAATDAAGQASAAGTVDGRTAAGGGNERVLRVRASQISRLLGLAGESLVESDRVRELAPLLTGVRRGHTSLVDLLNVLDLRLGSPQRNSAVGQGLHALRAKLQEVQGNSVAWSEAFEDHARRSQQLSARLFREASDTRMRPLGDGLALFPRLVRDLARRLGKPTELLIEGEDLRIDRDILERIEAPLNHLIRNALDHGIEATELRRVQHKPERATLEIRARIVAGFIQLDVIDDGAGIDADKVRARIVEKGLAEHEAVDSMAEERLHDFLFRSGFSTAAKVTELSGRGVGLAVVRSVMRDIGGTVRVRSQPGLGACFTLQVPISRSVLRSVVVAIGGEPYAFGLASVTRIARVAREQLRSVDGRPYVTLEDKTVALVQTAALLELGAGATVSEALDVVVVGARPYDLGFVVEAVLGQHDLVLHALDPRLGRIPDISAAAILPDGRPVVVLDVDDLCQSALGSGPSADSARLPMRATTPPARKHILVVDDSPTVRQTEREALSRVGYEVSVAGDGLEAWQMLRRGRFDLVVTDIDMPRLDGLSLLRSIRQDRVLESLPVVMMSYRGSAEDSSAGLAAGADVYLLKADFDEQQLCDVVQRLIGAPIRS